MNGTYLRSSKLYDWMAEDLSLLQRLIEFGTGGGHSTLSLLRQGHSVIGIDENPFCLAHAAELLRAEGFHVEVIQRGRPRLTVDGTTFWIEYDPINVRMSNETVYLIEGNIFADPNLLEWLHSNQQFDGGVCWLTGGHKLIRKNTLLPTAIRTATAQLYRIQFQEQVYCISDTLIKEGGALSFVDRGDEPTGDIAAMSAAFLALHAEQAKGTDFEPSTVRYCRYDDSYLEHKRGIKINRSSGNQASTARPPRPTMIALAAIKR